MVIIIIIVLVTLALLLTFASAPLDIRNVTKPKRLINTAQCNGVHPSYDINKNRDDDDDDDDDK